MYKNKNNRDNIEKFNGKLEQEDSGFSIVLNKSITEIRNMAALAVYTYLLTRPPEWQLNVKQLASHFQCSKDFLYKSLNYLLENGYITRLEVRNKGQFSKSVYRVNIRRNRLENRLENRLVDFEVDFKIDQRKTRASTEFSPRPVLPDPVPPDTVRTDTYKIKNIINKESINKRSLVDSANTTKGKKVKSLKNKPTHECRQKGYKQDSLFMEFYLSYPRKEKPEIARAAFVKHKPTPDFVQMLVADVRARLANNWADRAKDKIPMPATYLNAKEWEGEIYAPSVKDEPSIKNKTTISSDGIEYSGGQLVL